MNNYAWHFVGEKLRDGRPIPADGEWLEHKGSLVLCESGLHWSKEPFDALQYAPGSTLCLVEYGGEVKLDTDKGISTRRKIIARMDAAELLRYFARDESLRAAAVDAAGAAAVAAARAAARDAARAGAWDAARQHFNELVYECFEEWL